MPIDTHMPGNPQAVFTVADWLEALGSDLGDNARQTGRLRDDSSWVWSGDASDAYRDFGADLKKAAEEIEDRVDTVEGKVRAYGQQLRWRQEDMADHRDQARSGGLVVVGTVIQQPPAAVGPGALPADHTPEERTAWDAEQAAYGRARDKVDLYNELLTDVRGTFDQLDTWVTDNLVDMEAGASSPFSVAVMLGFASGLGLGIPESRFAQRSATLRAAAVQAAEALARSRSGNPAVRSGSRPPRQVSVERASRPGTRAGNLLGQSDEALTWAKRLAKGGVITSLALGAWEISNGESPSKVVIETGVGLAAGVALAAGGAALVTLGAPVVVVAVGVVAAGALISVGAGWAYETFVPQDVREAIDEGIKDTWNGAVDVAEDVGDAIGDAWNSVFG